MSSDVGYSRLDRLLHSLAFDSELCRNVFEEMEASLFSRVWEPAAAARPIFVTSLPRAGTTILLEALSRLPGLAFHTYRDMPFVTAPVLWHMLSERFHRRNPGRERAHGDGLMITEDSPEAFDEVLWNRHYGQKYTSDGIALWGDEDMDGDFCTSFREHMKKVIYLRTPSRLSSARYLSKNNGNVARVSLLLAMFADASILLPVRDPIEHAMSMWRQHQNFSQQQLKEPFVRKYMGDIGHFEFGDLHRPIRFPGLESIVDGRTPGMPDYWVAYWIAAFEYLMDRKNVFITSYESLCREGKRSMARLCEVLDIAAMEQEIAEAATVFKAVPPSKKGSHDLDEGLCHRAMARYESLRSRCVLSA